MSGASGGRSGGASSPYITKAGLEALQAELAGLWAQRREVVAALAAAAAEGDRSENAEYIYRKKQLREMDRRIRYLTRRIPMLRPVSGCPADPQRIYFGATVALCDADGREVRYRIVGSDETDASRGWISVDSPLARALIGHRVGDELRVRTPGGWRVLEVLDIGYETEPG
ncbi:MAG: transcription elongation factor GreB [Wenzhouxiangellaceae bacterium]